jgi:hypothetical protein
MTDVTAADIQNMTPEQLAALANAINAEQSAAAAMAQPAAGTAASPATQAVPVQNEAPINPVASAVLNGVNVATQAATAVEPVVAAINPAAGMAITVGVQIVNSLEAMAGWLGMIPPGQATQGIQTEIANIKALIAAQ